MNKEIKCAQIVRYLSLAIPFVFFGSLYIYFLYNKAAYSYLGILNLFQFNMRPLISSTAFIPALISYFIVGLMICVLWTIVWIKFNKLKIAAFIFILCGAILIILGLIPIDNKVIRPAFALLLSFVFIVLNLVGMMTLLANSNMLLNKLVLLFVMGSLVYKLYDVSTDFNSDLDFNTPIVICLLSYLFLYKYLNQEFSISKSVNNRKSQLTY